jgi:hypothetical protein
MKVLFINKYIHFKNKNALLKYKNDYTIKSSLDNVNLSEFDVVYSPAEQINTDLYPMTKFIFGPHFSVFPEKHSIDVISKQNAVYVQPGDWSRNVWRNNPLCNNLRIESLPFGVETDVFNEVLPLKERSKIFVYFKSRHPNELKYIQQFLNDKNIKYELFNYQKKYNETDYLKYLQKAKYGIWLGRHESQGFALEEALSCNVPLLVWNVKSMNQEYGYNYSDIPASCIPYWDERCGEQFYNQSELNDIFNLFISKLEHYKARDYIMENLTIEHCEQKLVDLVDSFYK